MGELSLLILKHINEQWLLFPIILMLAVLLCVCVLDLFLFLWNYLFSMLFFGESEVSSYPCWVTVFLLVFLYGSPVCLQVYYRLEYVLPLTHFPSPHRILDMHSIINY